MRKLILLFTILAGVFAFQGNNAVALPREEVRTELVVKLQREEIKFAEILSPRKEYFVRNTRPAPSQLGQDPTSFLISFQYFHSGL